MPSTISRRPTGEAKELFHGAAFPFAGDRERGQQHGGDGEQIHGQAGYHEQRRAGLGVEQGEHLHLQRRLGGKVDAAQALGAHQAVDLGQDLVGHHAVGAVDDELDFAVAAGGQIAFIVGGNGQRGQGLAPANHAQGSGLVAVGCDVKFVARAHRADQGARGCAAIAVEDHQGNPVHVEADAETEDEQHDHRHGQRHVQRARIAPDVHDFLGSHGAHPNQKAQPAWSWRVRLARPGHHGQEHVFQGRLAGLDFYGLRARAGQGVPRPSPRSSRRPPLAGAVRRQRARPR